MNIEALRRTQLSIMDTNLPFHMGSWYSCIACHAIVANTSEPMLLREPDDIEERAMGILGIDWRWTMDLFYDMYLDRLKAVQRIDDLIASGAHVCAAKAPERRLNSAETEVAEELELVGV